MKWNVQGVFCFTHDAHVASFILVVH